MTSSMLPILLLLSLVPANHVMAALSKQANDYKSQMAGVTGITDSGCDKEFKDHVKTLASDADVFGLCNELTKKTKAYAACKTPADVTKITTDVCKINKDATDKKAKLLKSVQDAATTPSCTTKLAGFTATTTWKELNELCDKVQNTDKTDYQTKCPGQEYTSLEGAVCANTGNGNNNAAAKPKGTQRTISDKATDSIDQMKEDVTGLSIPCKPIYEMKLKSLNTDKLVFGFCTAFKNRVALDYPSCSNDDQTKIEAGVCKIIKSVDDQLEDIKKKISAIGASVTTACQNEVKSMTWMEQDTMCSSNKFGSACNADDINKLTEVACGGASSILAGLLTVCMCMVVSMVTKSE